MNGMSEVWINEFDFLCLSKPVITMLIKHVLFFESEKNNQYFNKNMLQVHSRQFQISGVLAKHILLPIFYLNWKQNQSEKCFHPFLWVCYICCLRQVCKFFDYITLRFIHVYLDWLFFSNACYMYEAQHP